VEGSLRNVGQVADELVEERGFLVNLECPSLLSVHSKALSMELNQETPETLGMPRNIKKDEIPLDTDGGTDKLHRELETSPKEPVETDDPVGGNGDRQG